MAAGSTSGEQGRRGRGQLIKTARSRWLHFALQPFRRRFAKLSSQCVAVTGCVARDLTWEAAWGEQEQGWSFAFFGWLMAF